MDSVSPSYSEYKSPLRRPTPSLLIITTVAQACEELWSAGDASQAQQWLRLLQLALSRDPIGNYDPSETFLCIQAAAYNYPQSTWEPALWAVAALVRVCVGPAWRKQRLGNLGSHTPGTTAAAASTNTTARHNGSPTETTLSESTAGSGSHRNHGANSSNNSSPRSLSPFQVIPGIIDPQDQRFQFSHLNLQHSQYSHIPEVLPGAILRFAANAPWESRSLAEAQREIVLALCCGFDAFDQQDRTPEWKVLGSHDSVESMMLFWLESLTSVGEINNDADVCSQKPQPQIHAVNKNENETFEQLNDRLSQRTMDWWYTLHVVRACSDIISVGLCPKRATTEIVLHLLSVVEHGISLRFLSPTETSQDIREERLAATSSAAEAVSALLSLGTRGLFSHHAQVVLATKLIMIQAVAANPPDYSISMYPFGKPRSADEEHEWQQELDTFLHQRTSFFADAADLLWALMAHESSSFVTMKTLLDEKSFENLSNGAVVVRIVSGALWGTPPSVSGIPTIRLFWTNFLLSLREQGKTCLESVQAKCYSTEHIHTTKKSMALTLEVIVATSRMLEYERTSGMNFLTTDEWNELMKLLKVVIFPCLRLEEDNTVLMIPDESSRQKLQKIMKVVQKESQCIIMRLVEYLEKSDQFACQHFHSISSGMIPDCLHFCLLTEALPGFPKSTKLAIQVLRSWAAVGFLPFRKAAWIDTASSIISSTFSIIQDASLPQYDGYVYSPAVRLEAIMLLSNDRVDALNDMSSETVQMRPSRTSMSTPWGSPMDAIKYIPEEYIELLRNAILPSLSMVFKKYIMNNDDREALIFKYENFSEFNAIPINSNLLCALSQSVKYSNNESCDQDNFQLLKYCISLLGKIYNSNLGKCQNYRENILNIMGHTAVAQLPHLSITKEKNGIPLLSEEISYSVRNKALLCLEVMGQIESCICAPFLSIPHTTAMLPLTIDTLCRILRHFAENCMAENGMLWQEEYLCKILMFAALLPLARLRRSSEGNLLLVQREEVMDHLPIDVYNFFSEKQDSLEEDCSTFGTLSAKVESNIISKNEQDMTIISLEPVASTLVEVLCSRCNQSSDCQSQVRDRSEDLENRFRSACYDTLTSYLMTGLTFSSMNLALSLIRFPKRNGPYSGTENFTRLRACLASLQSRLQTISAMGGQGVLSQNIGVTCTPVPALNDFIEQILSMVLSDTSDDVVCGCKLLIGTFSLMNSLRDVNEGSSQALLRRIFKALISKIGTGLLCTPDDGTKSPHKDVKDNSDSDLCLSLLLYESFLYCSEYPGILSPEEANVLLKVSFDVLRSNRKCLGSRTFALRCAIGAMHYMSINDVNVFLNQIPPASHDHSVLQANIQSSSIDNWEEDLIFSALFHRSLAQTEAHPKLLSNFAKDHIAFAEELSNLTSFETYKESSAGWLCGNHLLTLKIGKRKSRYCGWCEIIFRGATFLKRKMVRLPCSVSIENPELISSLWMGPEPKSCDNNKSSVPLKSLHIGEESDIHKKALSMLIRSNQVLGLNEDNCDVVNRYPSTRTSLEEQYRLPISDKIQSSDKLVDFDGLPLRLPSTKRDLDEQNSIRHWLDQNLGNLCQINAVIDNLLIMGIGDILVEASNPNLHPVLKLLMDEKLTRSISLLDRTVVLDAHKIGLLSSSSSSSPFEDDEDEEDLMLRSKVMSPHFNRFCLGLGKMVPLRFLKFFSGGLDTSGADIDGKYSLLWIENSDEESLPTSCITIFHNVACMPSNLNNRKRHVGNDCVLIIFCNFFSSLHTQLWIETMEETMETALIGGEFGFVTIFVIPMSSDFYRIKVQLKPDLPESVKDLLRHLPGEDIVSELEAPNFVRRLAVLADITCSVALQEKLGPTTIWENRLKQIRALSRYKI